MSDGLGEIRERLAHATPAPWRHVKGEGESTWVLGPPHTDELSAQLRHGTYHGPEYGLDKDADFIAPAPGDVAYLLERIARLTAVARAAKPFGDPDCWTPEKKWRPSVPDWRESFDGLNAALEGLENPNG